MFTPSRVPHPIPLPSPDLLMSLFPTVLSFPLPPLLSHAPLAVCCVLALIRASIRYLKKKGTTSTRSCSVSGISIAVPDTPTTFTCSHDKVVFGRSLCLIDDFVALVSTRKGICRPSIAKVSFGSSRGLEVNNGNSDDASPRSLYWCCVNKSGRGEDGADGVSQCSCKLGLMSLL